MNIFFRQVFSLTIMILILSCYNKYSKKSHKFTTKLADGLYIETFTVYGSGAFGTDMVSDYLTDSSSFRKYIGTYDEGPEFYYYRISGDTIKIEKFKSKKLIGSKTSSLTELKKSNNIK